MEQDLNATVEDYRRRVADQAEEVQRLRSAVNELGEQADAGGSGKAAKPLQRAQADLQRAQRRLRGLQHDYARFRLREGLGPDPAHLDAQCFDAELLRISQSRLCRKEPREPHDGRIGFDSFRSLLVADLSLDRLLENERHERQADVIIDEAGEDSGTKGILRQWAAMLQSDRYVSEAVLRANDEAARFTACLSEFTRGLENVRINYEISRRQVDRLAFAHDGGKPAIHASNYWSNVEELFPRECRALYGSFLGLEQARDELRRIHGELNGELRDFMASFVPRYITYATRQSSARRRRTGLSRSRARRLCQYLLDEIAQTDFLLPRGGGLELAPPRIPRDIAPFRKLKAFREYKKQLERAAFTDARTVAQDTA